MFVLGFNSTHDASVALLRGSEVCMAIEEERLSRRKHHYGFPGRALALALERAGIRASDLDGVGFYWDPWCGLFRFGGHFLRHLPRSWFYLRSARQQDIWSEFRRLPRRFREELGFRGRFRFCRHHEAHCASAFFPSGFDEAAILSVDGTGEWTTTMLARGAGTRLRVLKEIHYPHSLGKVYESVTQYLGFRRNSGEGKVMGLSSYGRPVYRDVFDRMVRIRPDGSFRVDTRYFAYHLGHPLKFGARLVRELGPSREPESELRQRHADVAASLQARVGDAVVALCRTLARQTGSSRLCLAGGVGHNSVINGRILRETPFEQIFVQPAAHDAGAALGAAWLTGAGLAHDRGESWTRPSAWQDAALGPGYSREEQQAALESSSLEWRRCPDPAAAAATLLDRGRILGWFQGRAEYGPRALGNRSILADPRRAEMKDRVNRRVKFRESFRPFAAAVPVDRAREYFDTSSASPFMLLVFPVREDRRHRIPAVVHVDGTSRVQTVDPRGRPLFYRLLEEFDRRTGVPVLLNTSFNRRGEPMVCSPADAVACFTASDLDVLFLGDLMAWKGGQDPFSLQDAGGVAGSREEALSGVGGRS